MPFYDHAIVQQAQDIDAAIFVNAVKQLVPSTPTWTTDVEQPIAGL